MGVHRLSMLSYMIAAVGFRRLTMAAVPKSEVLFVLGGPGAGKGTLCRLLFEKYGYIHLSAGDLLREERRKPGSEFGELIETHIKNGTIVPAEITCGLLERAMTTSKASQKKFLIDGFPRNEDNLASWNQMMPEKVTFKGVIFCECSQEVCTERCLKRGAAGSGRTDDNKDTLIQRHNTYIKHTLPIIEYYEKQGLVFRFNSMKPPLEVLKDVEEFLPSIGW